MNFYEYLSLSFFFQVHGYILSKLNCFIVLSFMKLFLLILDQCLDKMS